MTPFPCVTNATWSSAFAESRSSLPSRNVGPTPPSPRAPWHEAHGAAEPGEPVEVAGGGVAARRDPGDRGGRGAERRVVGRDRLGGALGVGRGGPARLLLDQDVGDRVVGGELHVEPDGRRVVFFV